MIVLIAPDARLHASWLEAANEFGASYQHGSGLTPYGVEPRDGRVWRAADLADATLFADFVAYLLGLTDPANVRPFGMVPDSKFWIVDDSRERFLGSLSLRHELNEHLMEEGGHIGYSVRPSARRQGVATEALRQALDLARELRVDRALVTCEDHNEASARTIERNGGLLEDVRNGTRRYWIDLT